MTKEGEVRKSLTEDKAVECREVSTAEVTPPFPRGVRLQRVWAVWVPLLARASTLGLTLLGLAAIGMAAGESPRVHRLAERGSRQAVELVEGMGWLRPESPASTAEAGDSGRVEAGPAEAGDSGRVEAGPAEAGDSGRVEAGPAEAPAGVARTLPCVASAPDDKSLRPLAPVVSASAVQAQVPSSSAPRPTGARLRTHSPEGVTSSGKERERALAQASAASQVDSRLAINGATAAQLQSLPGIGAKRATQIVALRSRLGRFSELTDLLRVRGIGVKSLRKLLPHIRLNPTVGGNADRAELPAPGGGQATRL